MWMILEKVLNYYVPLSLTRDKVVHWKVMSFTLPRSFTMCYTYMKGTSLKA